MPQRGLRALGIAAVLVRLGVASAAAQTFEVVHAFRSGGDPRSILLRASDGYFYGTTAADGTERRGSIFRMDVSGSFVTLHSFHGPDGEFPTGALIEASDGYFYGTTSGGGDSGVYGTVFRMDAAGNLTTLYSFQYGADGGFPRSGLVEASDGNFYGTTIQGGTGAYGTVFRMTPAGGLLTIHPFSGGDGSAPIAPLIQGMDGLLYGTTSFGGAFDGGAAFKLNTSGVFTSLHSFDGNDEPANPQAPLVQAADGFFYGTGAAGGTGGGHYGASFRMDSAGNVTSLHFFSLADAQPQSPLTIGTDGFLYGTTLFSVFRMDTSGNTSTLHTFSMEEGQNFRGVVEADGVFFGTASSGGSGGRGAVFRVDAAGVTATVHAFDERDGAWPAAGLAWGSDGFLYGTSLYGGAAMFGNVFKMNLSGDLVSLHDFGATDGYPTAPVTEGADGAFYGVSGNIGGSANVYRLTTTGIETILHAFPADGTSSNAPLFLASDGSLYGATQNASESVFRIDAVGGYAVVHAFTAAEGSGVAGVIEASDGFFYGTAGGGGAANYGTVFRMSADGAVTVIHDFAFPEGVAPLAPLIAASDGFFYGTTSGGGVLGRGTVFRIDTAGTFSTVHELGGTEGANPSGPLVEAPDGWLYGATFYGPGTSSGTIFRVDPASGMFKTVHTFDESDSAFPLGGLVAARDGNLYGTASRQGPGLGVVYRLILADYAVTRIVPESGPAAGGTKAILRGTGFTPTTLVEVGGHPAPAAYVDPTHFEVTAPALPPGTLADVRIVAGASNAVLPGGFFVDFLDVPALHGAHADVERLVRYSITAGCGSGNFCPGSSVTRAQIAVFLLRARHGATYAPAACVGLFGDVPCPGPFADWIEALAAEGITGGCGAGNYCPASPVSRGQLSVFLLKARHDAAFVPPACRGAFDDVPCPSLFADWIEELLAEGITAGCWSNPPLYCPSNSVTRRQIAALLVNTFKLP